MRADRYRLPEKIPKINNSIIIFFLTNICELISKNKLFEKSYGGYALLGYRFGKLFPHLVYSQGTARRGLTVTSSRFSSGYGYDGKVTTYTAGVNYQLNDSAILKTAYQRSYVPNYGGGYEDVTQPKTSATTEKKYGDLVTAGVDFIF